MFVQIIQGHVGDAALLDAQARRWSAEIKPGATGFLGSTRGITDDGTGVAVVRFESEAAAAANSARPEQAAWWEQTAAAYDGEVSFLDCRDVDVMLDGGSDRAGFVQLISARTRDKEALRAMGASAEDSLRASRPDVLGGIIAWHDDDAFVQVVYFTSEDDARKGEAAMSDDSSAPDWASMMDGAPTFLDLRSPEFD